MNLMMTTNSDSDSVTGRGNSPFREFNHNKKTRILIVDDVASVRRRLREILEAEGYEVAGEAEDGDQAIAMAGELDPDVILMDIVMQNTDGLEATSRISGSGSKAKIVMFTQEATPSSVIRCMKTGAVNFVIKPSNRKQLVRVIENAMRFNA